MTTRAGKAVSADAKLLELEKQLEQARQIPIETDEELDEKGGIQLGLEGPKIRRQRRI